MKNISITILGRPASKKNNRRNFGKVSLPSLAYEKFRETALWQLKIVKDRFDTPVFIDYHFYQKGRLSQDSDNAQASINDVLQEAGIISDDTLITEGHFKKSGGYKDWSTTVEIKQLLETV